MHLPANHLSERPPTKPEGKPQDSPGAPPLTQAEERERAAYIERNLCLAFIGLLLFLLSLWGA